MGSGEPTTPAGLAARWDFFISYTKHDRSWAGWVAWILEENGYRVLLQAWDMVPGTNWHTGMHDGVVRSDRTIALFSTAYLRSVFGQQEWRAAHVQDPQGFERKLVPIRVEDRQRPGILSTIVAFDLFDLDSNAAEKELLRQISLIRAGRAKPTEPPSFPGPASASPRARRPPPLVQQPSNPKLSVLDGPPAPVKALAFFSGGRLLASGGSGPAISIFDVSDPSSPRLVASAVGQDGAVTALAPGPHPNTFASTNTDGYFTVWDLRSLRNPALRTGPDIVFKFLPMVTVSGYLLCS